MGERYVYYEFIDVELTNPPKVAFNVSLTWVDCVKAHAIPSGTFFALKQYATYRTPTLLFSEKRQAVLEERINVFKRMGEAHLTEKQSKKKAKHTEFIQSLNQYGQ